MESAWSAPLELSCTLARTMFTTLSRGNDREVRQVCTVGSCLYELSAAAAALMRGRRHTLVVSTAYVGCWVPAALPARLELNVLRNCSPSSSLRAFVAACGCDVVCEGKMPVCEELRAATRKNAAVSTLCRKKQEAKLPIFRQACRCGWIRSPRSSLRKHGAGLRNPASMIVEHGQQSRPFNHVNADT